MEESEATVVVVGAEVYLVRVAPMDLAVLVVLEVVVDTVSTMEVVLVGIQTDHRPLAVVLVFQH